MCLPRASPAFKQRESETLGFLKPSRESLASSLTPRVKDGIQQDVLLLAGTYLRAHPHTQNAEHFALIIEAETVSARERGGFVTRFRGAAASCILVVALLFSMSPGLGQSAVIQPKAAQVDFHMGYLEAVDYLNPFRGLNDPSYELFGFIYDYLFSLDQDGHPIPNLATDATCDTTCTNWTYTIRQGVKWSDGTDFTANDVVFTVNYNIRDFTHLWAFEPYVNRILSCAPSQTTGCGAVLTAPWQVTVYFDRPFAPGKIMFFPIIQEAQWVHINGNQAQGNYLNLNPIGTGPFIADVNIGTQWQNGAPLLLHKNPSYHLGAPHIDNLYMEQFSDEATLVGALRAGAIDLAKLTPNGYGALAGAAKIARQTALLSTQYWNEIGFTQLSDPSVNPNLNPARWDENVRRALAMATNKDFIVSNKYLGFGTRGDTLVSPITPQWWYDPTSEPGVNLTFDLAAANALLDAAGYTNWTGGSPGNGVRMAARDLTFNNTNGEIVTVPKDTQLVFTMGVRQEFQQEQDTAVYLQQEWLSVGVQLNLKIELESALSADVYGGALETYIWYWSADPDPNYILSIESSFTLDGWNDNYWANATYDQLYVDQLAATGVAQRQQLVRDAQKLNYESAVYIIYLYQNGTWAYRTDRFTGWGDWKAHPYRQMDAFWGANPLFLELTPIGGATNTCPTTPVIQPAGPIAAFVNTTQSFTGNASDPDANQNLTWTWSWSDTTQTVHQSTTAVTEDSASHQWSSAGLYNISLAVFDGLCTKTSPYVEVNVTDLPAAGVGWINGTVRDASSGSPLVGAALRALPGGYSQGTDAAGKFSLSVPEGTYTVTASALLFVSKSQSNIAVTANQTTVQDFALIPNFGWIAGTVTSTAGGAIAGAAIVIYGNNQEFSASTNAQGKYNKTTPPGTYSVQAGATGYVAVNKTGQVVTAGVTNMVDFALTPIPPADTGLAGRVYLGIGLAVIAVAAILIALYTRSRRKRKEEPPGIVPPPP